MITTSKRFLLLSNGTNIFPRVPSAQDVEQKGLDLGDTQALLLQKIEGLTLYVIQPNQKLADQKAGFEKQLKELVTKPRKKSYKIASLSKKWKISIMRNFDANITEKMIF